MSTELIEVTTAIANIDKVGAGIAALAERFKGVIYEVATTAGLDDARAARAEIREPRYEVERIRKAAKAPILALGKRLDAEAARITGELEKLETPIDAQIKAEEKRIEDTRQAKIAAEVKRVADIHARIRDMSNGITLLCATSHLSVIENWIEKTEAVAIDDSFAEFRGNAEIEKVDVLRRLRELHAAATAHQQAEDALKAERERLAAERAEQEERNRVERERIAAEDVERKRAAEVAEASRRETARVAQEGIDAANAAEVARLKKIRDDQEADNAAERERLANQARVLAEEQRKLDAEREKLEVVVPVAPPEAEKPAEFAYQFGGFPRPSFDVIVAVVVRQFQASEEQVRTWIMAVPESER